MGDDLEQIRHIDLTITVGVARACARTGPPTVDHPEQVGDIHEPVSIDVGPLDTEDQHPATPAIVRTGRGCIEMAPLDLEIAAESLRAFLCGPVDPCAPPLPGILEPRNSRRTSSAWP